MATAEETTGEVGHAEHVPGVFPPFDSSTFGVQLFWLVIVFGALYVLMSKIGLPRVASILEARRAAHEGDLAEAGRLKDETDKAIASFEQALADAHAHAEQIGEETRDRLNAEIIAKRSSFDAELTANLDAEERTIAEAKARAMSNVGEIAAESALAIVGRLVGIEMPLQDARSAVDQFVKS